MYDDAQTTYPCRVMRNLARLRKPSKLSKSPYVMRMEMLAFTFLSSLSSLDDDAPAYLGSSQTIAFNISIGL